MEDLGKQVAKVRNRPGHKTWLLEVQCGAGDAAWRRARGAAALQRGGQALVAVLLLLALL